MRQIAEANEEGEAGLAQFHDLDVEFHTLILHESGNELFAALSDTIATVLRGRVELGKYPMKPKSDALDAHDAVADAIAKGEPERARSAMLDIVDEVARALNFLLIFRAKLAFFGEKIAIAITMRPTLAMRDFFRRKATSEIRHEGSSANVSFGEYEDAGEYPRRLGAFLVAKRKLHYCSKMRMQNQSVLVIGFACAVASKCYFTLLAGGAFAGGGR